MAVLSKFDGIVIRMQHTPLLGARFNAFWGDAELVVGLWPVRVIQGEAPDDVRRKVLSWAFEHERELNSAWSCVERHRAPSPIPNQC